MERQVVLDAVKMTATKGKTMTARKRLTAEQEQRMADLLAQFDAENAAKAKRRPRITLGLPHTITQKYNFRLEREMGDSIIEIGLEVYASRSAIASELLEYAFTGKKTANVDVILESTAAKEYVSKKKD